ncbi:MAG: ABC transporter substrate-binding protein [Candidatus Limiplasma sp.]|nr:ABC transporter substrate-binding protein [Candidatus Limiplasma sp.]
MKKVLAMLLALSMVLGLACAALAEEGKPVRGGALIVAKGVKQSTMDPTKANAQDSDYDLYAQVYEPLVGMDASGNLIPCLAESWDVQDETTIVFKLREGVVFHDGTPFNAEAVKFVMDWYKSEECSPWFASQIAELESVEAVDEYTVKMHLSTPSAVFLTSMSNYTSLMISPQAIETYGAELSLNAVGTGAFKVKEAVEGDHITLVRNEQYWGLGEDGLPLPYLDEVVIKIIEDETVKATNVMSGGVHLTDYLKTAVNIQMLQANASLTVDRLPTADIYCLFPNVNFDMLQDARVRQALAYALNTEEMAMAMTQGLGNAAIWPANQSQWFYSDYTPYSYNPEKAKELLAEAGYPDGFSIKLQCISREPDNTIMQVVQQQLGAVGVNVTLESMERLAWVDLYTKQLTGELGLAKMTYPRVDAYVQLNTNMGGTSGNNYSQYKGEKFNELLEKIKLEYDMETRKALLAEAQQVYLEDSATIFLYELPRYVAYSSQLKNYGTYSLGHWKLATMWLAQ